MEKEEGKKKGSKNMKQKRISKGKKRGGKRKKQDEEQRFRKMKANDTIAKQRPMKIEKERINYAPKNIGEKKKGICLQETEGKYGKVWGEEREGQCREKEE